MRSDLEKGGVRCARKLAGLFDDAYALTQRFTTEIEGGGAIDFAPLKREWNAIHDRFEKIVPTADAIGADEIFPTDQRFWSLATFQSCVPRMKACVDLQLMALKIAFGCSNEDQADFALGIFRVMPEQFAPLVLACRDAPKLKSKHAESAEEFLRAINAKFRNELKPLYDQAAAMIPLIEEGDGSMKS
jgi:hypothetical protein